LGRAMFVGETEGIRENPRLVLMFLIAPANSGPWPLTQVRFKKLNFAALVDKRIPTERLPLVGKVSAKFCG
jgi:hypothetical protein